MERVSSQNFLSSNDFLWKGPGFLAGTSSRGVELSEEDGRCGAREDADCSVCEERADDASDGIGVAVDERDVPHGDVSGSGEKGEGRRSQRVVGADGFEHDANQDGERETSKEVFTEESQSERECRVWQDDETQREEATNNSVGEVQRPQPHAPGDHRKQGTSEQSWNECAGSPGEADGACGGVESAPRPPSR
jgi:hypothetical protein